jgi:hypothetical protein
MAYKRLGELLIDLAVMSPEQVEHVLKLQQQWGLPFGAIASRVFGVDERAIWRARAIQVGPQLPSVNLLAEPRQQVAQQIILKDEAIYYGLLPLRTEQGELICATTEDCLPEAMAYLCSTIRIPTCFVLAEPGQLQDEILKTYGLGTDRLAERLEHEQAHEPRIPGRPDPAETAPNQAQDAPLPQQVREVARDESPDPAKWPTPIQHETQPASQPRRKPHPPVGDRVPQPRIDDARPFLKQALNLDEPSGELLMSTPTKIRFACACGQAIKVPSSYAGKRVRCAACKAVQVVPEAADPAKQPADHPADTPST